MKVGYDDQKDRQNRAKHGLPLAIGGPVVAAARERGAVVEDRRRNYGEPRYIAYGKVHGRLLVCVFTPRGAGIRVISVRKANSRERHAYD
jgi:hypothetical protein